MIRGVLLFTENQHSMKLTISAMSSRINNKLVTNAQIGSIRIHGCYGGYIKMNMWDNLQRRCDYTHTNTVGALLANDPTFVWVLFSVFSLLFSCLSVTPQSFIELFELFMSLQCLFEGK